MKYILPLICLFLLPVSAHSGAWPREEKTVFLAFSNTISFMDETLYATDSSLYLEYGLTPRVTVGIDGFLGAPGTASEAFMFFRAPIGKTDRASRMAFTVAVGGSSTPDPFGPTREELLAKFGTSWGRGLKRGWLAVDAYVTTPTLDPAATFNADFTWGQKPSDRLMLIWQVQTGKLAEGNSFAIFAPSVVLSIGQKNTQIELGLVRGLDGDDSRGLKLGFWKSF